MADNEFKNALTTELKEVDNIRMAKMWYERNVNVLMEKDHGWMSFEDILLNDLAELNQYCAECTHPRIFLNLIKNVIETKKKIVALAQQPAPPAENNLLQPVSEEGGLDPPIPRPAVAEQALEAHVPYQNLISTSRQYRLIIVSPRPCLQKTTLFLPTSILLRFQRTLVCPSTRRIRTNQGIILLKN